MTQQIGLPLRDYGTFCNLTSCADWGLLSQGRYGNGPRRRVGLRAISPAWRFFNVRRTLDTWRLRLNVSRGKRCVSATTISAGQRATNWNTSACGCFATCGAHKSEVPSVASSSYVLWLQSHLEGLPYGAE